MLGNTMRLHTGPHGPSVAMNRFGLGARPGDGVDGPPPAWVLDHLATYRAKPPATATLERGEPLAARFLKAQREFRALRRERAPGSVGANPAAVLAEEAYAVQLRARIALALQEQASFGERLVHFWSNHFAVSADKPLLRALAGTLEFEAIRPHILGRFSELLLAVERHPAMLVYLDQARSIGPNSVLARQRSERRDNSVPGLNENLARELLELHTLGGGYSQTDVVELALALTGWAVGGIQPFRDRELGRATFHAEAHEPGERQCLRRRYPDGGEEQALAILHDLSVHPSTARHVALKLARHFVADEPTIALVERLAQAFLRTGGELMAVYRALVEAPEAWTSELAKFKSPWEWMISALRAVQLPQERFPVRRGLSDLGQPVWRPRSPAGWADQAQTWAAPYTLYVRVRLAEKMAEAVEVDDPRALAHGILPGVLSRRSASVVAEADRAAQGLALLLCAPEFLRR